MKIGIRGFVCFIWLLVLSGCASIVERDHDFSLEVHELFDVGFGEAVVVSGNRIGWARNLDESVRWKTVDQRTAASLGALIGPVCASLPGLENQTYSEFGPHVYLRFECSGQSKSVTRLLTGSNAEVGRLLRMIDQIWPQKYGMFEPILERE